MAQRPAARSQTERPPDGVAAYKEMLAAVIDRRPSGTRQRLAAALSKNRSFISQITSPAYPTPIPANHLELIFEVCHFSPVERRRFIDAYQRAHPARLAASDGGAQRRPHTVTLPDLGDEARNALLQSAVADFVRQVARILDNKSKQGNDP